MSFQWLGLGRDDTDQLGLGLNMKFNDKELAELSFDKGAIEGRLHHKKITGNFSQAGFKEKWFKLKSNILFYFHLSDTGQITDKKPAGAMVLEQHTVQLEMMSETPFSFSITFHDEPEKKHLFSARSMDNVHQWVAALKLASYEHWREQLLILQARLAAKTGKDPLLMFPRNVGCCVEALPNNQSNQRSPSQRHKKRQAQSSFRSHLPPEPERTLTTLETKIQERTGGVEETQQADRQTVQHVRPAPPVPSPLHPPPSVTRQMEALRLLPPPPPPQRPPRSPKRAASKTSENLIDL